MRLREKIQSLMPPWYNRKSFRFKTIVTAGCTNQDGVSDWISVDKNIKGSHGSGSSGYFFFRGQNKNRVRYRVDGMLKILVKTENAELTTQCGVLCALAEQYNSYR